MEMVTIDGSFGEGGGQILRSSLALSLVSGKPVRIENIRARRKKPGLLRQHLTAVLAAAEVGAAEVAGATLGSSVVVFTPGAVRGGEYRFAVGTAGSATLVLQAILPALIRAEEPSEVTLEGGTHNPYAPPFDYLERVFLPLLGRMGPKVSLFFDRYGFYPAGGGRFRAVIEPAPLEPIDLLDRGEVVRRSVRALVARLPERIATAELNAFRELLPWKEEEMATVSTDRSFSPGNVVMAEVASEGLTELFAAFGDVRVPARKVAGAAADQVRRYLADGNPVGEHLADQLLLPMALAGGGRFRTTAPTLHTTTNAEVIRCFLDIGIVMEKEKDRTWRIEIRGEKK